MDLQDFTGNPDPNDPSSDNDGGKMDDGTNPQAVATPLKCPKCQYSFGMPEIDDPGEEASASFNQDEINEQADVDQDTLNELKDVMLDLFKWPASTEGVNFCKTNSIDPKKLLQFFKDLKAQQPKKSYIASLSQYCFGSSKLKVLSIVTGQTFGADEAILEQVNKGIALERTGLQECDIIIVFCPITSRVGSDMETAKNNIPGSKPAVLVLMHHTRDVNYPTGAQRSSIISNNIELDVDILFHRSQSGLLKCSRNNQAIQEIQRVFKKHNKKK